MMELNMKGFMDRDEELSLFKELRKRQNERISTFLQCASEEYECDTNGKFSLYRIPSGKKEYGFEFLETNKNDYDWLKTPPATPLFPSLEMEPSAQLVVQKEIPISQPLSFSRFSRSDVEAQKSKSTDTKPNQTNSTKAKLAMRSITPSHNRQRPRIIKNTNDQQSHTTNKINNAKLEAHGNTKSTPQKQTNNNADFLALNLKKSIEANESQRKQRTRGVSPSVRSRVPIMELSNEAPPNLRTEQRSNSTTRGRSTTRASSIVGLQNSDPAPRTFRPSRSPSPSMANGGWNQIERTQKNMRAQKETFTLAAGTKESRAHFKGSKMVEKVINARKFGTNQAERETKPKTLKHR